MIDDDFADVDIDDASVSEDETDEDPKLPAWWLPYVDVLDEIIKKHFPKLQEEARWPTRDKVRVRAAQWCDPIGDLFMGVYWDDVPADELSGYHRDEDFNRYHARWRHRGIHEVNKDIKNLCISEDFKNTVGTYLKKPEWRNEFIDWYIADTLAYLELYRTIEHVQGALGGHFSMALIRGSGGEKFFGYLLRTIFFVVKWTIWLAALLFVTSEWEALGVVGLILPTVAYQYVKRMKRNKVLDLLTRMRGAYDVFASHTFSWEVAWVELNSSREKGAVWPGELYRLVELRKAGQ